MAERDDEQRAETLLPWYLTGSLREAETDAVNEALAASERLQRLARDELRLSQQMQDEPPGLNRVLQRKAHAFQDLLHRIDTGSNVSAGGPAPSRCKLAAARLFPVAALCVAAGIGIGLWINAPSPGEPAYVGLTEPAAPARATPHGAIIVQVVATPDADAAAFRELLASTGGVILSGPSHNGLYRLAIAPSADLAAHLERLHAAETVGFVAEER